MLAFVGVCHFLAFVGVWRLLAFVGICWSTGVRVVGVFYVFVGVVAFLREVRTNLSNKLRTEGLGL